MNLERRNLAGALMGGYVVRMPKVALEGFVAWAKTQTREQWVWEGQLVEAENVVGKKGYDFVFESTTTVRELQGQLVNAANVGVGKFSAEMIAVVNQIEKILGTNRKYTLTRQRGRPKQYETYAVRDARMRAEYAEAKKKREEEKDRKHRVRLARKRSFTRPKAPGFPRGSSYY